VNDQLEGFCKEEVMVYREKALVFSPELSEKKIQIRKTDFLVETGNRHVPNTSAECYKQYAWCHLIKKEKLST